MRTPQSVVLEDVYALVGHDDDHIFLVVKLIHRHDWSFELDYNGVVDLVIFVLLIVLCNLLALCRSGVVSDL